MKLFMMDRHQLQQAAALVSMITKLVSINLLRGVTPPHDAPAAAAAEEYGRYGAEEPAQRYERVLRRPADALFCMQCASTYSLAASASLPTPHGGAAATGGRKASAKE